MKRPVRKRLKNYIFLITFSISFMVYLSFLGVKTFCENRIADDKQQTTVVDNNQTGTDTETNTDVDQTGQTQDGTQETTCEGTECTEETTQESQRPENPPLDNKPPNGQMTNVDMSYLDGALFIGDSRTVTLSEFAGWDNTHFFVEVGLTIWSVMESEVANVNGQIMSVRDALSSNSYDKIYIMLGINELGRGSAESFCEQYSEVLNEIRQLQPNAVIYLQSIMHVSQEKDDQGTYINNAEIDARNAQLKNLADNSYIFWIDENEVFDVPGTGKLNNDFSFDGVHLMPQFIDIWKDFILSHAVVR